MSSSKPVEMVGGVGLRQIQKGRNAQKQQARVLRHHNTATPGKTLGMTATAQLWFKWGEKEAQALGEPVPCRSHMINSKACSASFQETLLLTYSGEHRHHVSIVVKFAEKTHGELAVCELHARKYLNAPNAASERFRESIKFKAPDKDRVKG